MCKTDASPKRRRTGFTALPSQKPRSNQHGQHTTEQPAAVHAGRHPTIFEPATLILLTVLCVVGAIIGMQLLVTLGVTANTSVVGAAVAMGLARVPIRGFMRYRSIHVQNLAQSAISAASNSLLLPIGIPFLLGRGDLVLPLLGGVALAMLVDASMLPATDPARANRTDQPRSSDRVHRDLRLSL
jgi:hypothetical protein